MESSQLYLPLIVLALILLMVITGIFRRVIAKLGLRNFYRHKGHAVISIMGLLVGTSIICASMVVGDSIEYFIVEETYDSLGEVDIQVMPVGEGYFNYSVYTDLAADPIISGSIDAISPTLVSGSTVKDLNTGLFESTVSVLGFDPEIDRAFGPFIDESGGEFYGDDLGTNDAIINRELADKLDAGVNDTLLFSYSLGRTGQGAVEFGNTTLSVRYIAESEGKAIYSTQVGRPGQGPVDSLNVFVRLDVAQAMFEQPGKINQIKISNVGGVVDGAEGSIPLASTISSSANMLTEPVVVSHETLTPSPFNETVYVTQNPGILPETLRVYVNDTPTTSYFLNASSGAIVFVPPISNESVVNVSYYHEPPPLAAVPIKQQMLVTAETISEMITTFLTIFGSFAIIAGVILIVNIFTMLAEERKSELGMARAVGMKRRHLMLSFLFEGLAYGTVAAAVGTIVGVLVGFFLIYLVNDFVSLMNVQLPLHFEWFSLVDAFSLGFLITFSTIMVTSWRISKLNIIRAIRGIEEPPKDRKNLLPTVLGALLLLAGLAIYRQFPENYFVLLLGPCAIIVGTMTVLYRWIGDRASVSTASFGVLVYCFYAFRTYFVNMEGQSADILFIISGIFIVLSFVMLVMYNSNVVIHAVTGTLGRIRKIRPTILTAVSYPLTKKFRTGMTVAMFALVIFMIAMLSVFSTMFIVDVEEEVVRQGGGFDIMGTTSFGIDDIYNTSHTIDPLNGSRTLNNNITRVVQVSFAYTPKIYKNNDFSDEYGEFHFEGGAVYGIGQDFVSETEYNLTSLAEGHSTPDEAWEAVIAPGSNKIVINSFMTFMMGYQTGDVLAMTNPVTGTVTQNYEVIAVSDQGVFMGIIMSKENVERDLLTDTNQIFLFDVADGYNISATASDLERDFGLRGMDTDIIREIAEENAEFTSSMFALFEIYLNMGMVVGVAGLGVITVRSVVERTPEIGILRSLGFKRKNIRNAFLTEILFVASLGVVIGLISGILVANEIFNAFADDMGGNVSFVIPWARLAVVVGIAYIATIVCTIVPANNASKISPAEALRYVG